LILMSWRTRLRPEARRGFFFLGLADAIYKFFQCLRMMSSEPGILADPKTVPHAWGRSRRCG
jgi:hypothetical protein